MCVCVCGGGGGGGGGGAIVLGVSGFGIQLFITDVCKVNILLAYEHRVSGVDPRLSLV